MCAYLTYSDKFSASDASSVQFAGRIEPTKHLYFFNLHTYVSIA